MFQYPLFCNNHTLIKLKNQEIKLKLHRFINHFLLLTIKPLDRLKLKQKSETPLLNLYLHHHSPTKKKNTDSRDYSLVKISQKRFPWSSNPVLRNDSSGIEKEIFNFAGGYN